MTSTEFLDHLPSITAKVALYRVDSAGMVLEHSGCADSAEFEVQGSRLGVELPAGRDSRSWLLPKGGEWLVVTFQQDPATGEPFGEFMEALFSMLNEKSQLERDMESMYASSLALLEEVSMVGDVMPKLPTGETEEAIARMGLDALMVAASVQRAIYARYHPRLGECEILVHLVMDEGSRKPGSAPIVAGGWRGAEQGLVARAIQGSGSAIMECVPEGGRLGQDGSPEWFANREVIAAPVRYGDGDDEQVLGVLFVMDKQATAYSNVVNLGSQESKMATAIASMLGSVLGTRMAAEWGKEMTMAMEIQKTILPEGPARVAGYDLAGRCLASGFVGGDYFDYLPMEDGRILVVAADVSGHNLASGMIMVSARATLRSMAAMHSDVAEIFSSLGGSLFQDLSKTERFITAAGVGLSAQSNRIELANAGHNDTMIYRQASGEVERIPSGGPILGFLEGISYSLEERELESGDVLILYTDGITESTNSAGIMFEETRLAESLAKASSGTAEGIVNSILAELAAFSGKSEEDDDLTLVVIKRTGED
ncbi:MAG: PP2C family protein-serine/threonine phosphatase [Planctomycetota bacterium]|jgi:hypothetical protein